MLTLASSVRALTPQLRPPRADTFCSASTATAGHWSGVAREAVLSGDRRVVSSAAFFTVRGGAAPGGARRRSTRRTTRTTPPPSSRPSSSRAPSRRATRRWRRCWRRWSTRHAVWRERYGSPGACVADALIRRYSPDERSGLRAHFDVTALCTCIVPLSAPDEYEGGLYVQPGAGAASREYVPFGAAGDAVFHEWDVMHGVRVEAGRRHSLVLWFAEDAACVADGRRRGSMGGGGGAPTRSSSTTSAAPASSARRAAPPPPPSGTARGGAGVGARAVLARPLLVSGEGVERDLAAPSLRRGSGAGLGPPSSRSAARPHGGSSAGRGERAVAASRRGRATRARSRCWRVTNTRAFTRRRGDQAPPIVSANTLPNSASFIPSIAMLFSLYGAAGAARGRRGGGRTRANFAGAGAP